MSSSGVDEGAGEDVPGSSSAGESNNVNFDQPSQTSPGPDVGSSSSACAWFLEDISSESEDDFGGSGGGGEIEASRGSKEDHDYKSLAGPMEKLEALRMDIEGGGGGSGGTPKKKTDDLDDTGPAHDDNTLAEVQESVSTLLDNVEKLTEDNCGDTSTASDGISSMDVEDPAPRAPSALETSASTTDEDDSDGMTSTAVVANDEGDGDGASDTGRASAAEAEPSTVEAHPDPEDTSKMEIEVEVPSKDDIVAVSPSPSSTAGGKEEGLSPAGTSAVAAASSTSSEISHDHEMASRKGVEAPITATISVGITSNDDIGHVPASEAGSKGTGTKGGPSGTPTKVYPSFVAPKVKKVTNPRAASGPGPVSKVDTISPAFNAKWEKIRIAKAMGRPSPHDPLPRHGHRAISYGKSLMLVFGGGTSNLGITGELHVFDTTINKWFQPEMKGEIPPGLAAFGIALDGSRVLIHGGMLECSSYSSDLYQLSIPNWEWKKLIPLVIGAGEVPCERLGHSFTIIWDKIILFGGLTNDGDQYWLDNSKFMNDLHVLHVRANNENGMWTQPLTFGKPPSPRESHTAVAHRSHWGMVNKLIVYGGTGRGGRFGDVHIFNLETMTWTKPELGGVHPAPRSLHSATLAGNKMYVFGGFISTSEDDLDMTRIAGKCSSSMACLNIDTLAWEGVRQVNSTTPPARAGHSATLVNTSIYVWSGRDGLKLNPRDGTQVCFPDLWKLEVEKPAAPKKLRRVISVDVCGSIKIRWDDVPGAKSYIVQCLQVNGDNPPQISNLQGGQPKKDSTQAVNLAKLVAAGYTPCPPKMTPLPVASSYPCPTHPLTGPPMKKVAFGPPVQLSASPYNGPVTFTPGGGITGPVWTSARPVGVPVSAWNPSSATVRGMNAAVNTVIGTNQLPIPIGFFRPQQLPLNPGLGLARGQFSRVPPIVRPASVFTGLSNQQRFQMGQFRQIRVVKDVNFRPTRPIFILPRTEASSIPTAVRPHQSPPPPYFASSVQANPPISPSMQHPGPPPVPVRPIISALGVGGPQIGPTTIPTSTVGIATTNEGVASAVVRHDDGEEGGGGKSSGNDNAPGTGPAP